MISRVLALWRSRQRNIDLEVLWPICKREAEAKCPPEAVLTYARAAFSIHAFNDKAWMALGEDEIRACIDALE